MKRFQKKRKFTKSVRYSVKFLKNNVLLFVLVICALVGAFAGTVLYNTVDNFSDNPVFSYVTTPQTPSDIISICKTVCQSSLIYLLFLMLLFLMGLTAFGCPVVLFTTIIYGFWVGLSQAHTFTELGFLGMLIYVHFPMIIAGTAVVMAAKRSILMSCLISRQLLSFGAHCGSLWQDFKRYLSLFLICISIVFGASTISVIAKLLYPIL